MRRGGAWRFGRSQGGRRGYDGHARPLGENGIKTVEDLAGCATDDLVGWSERKDGETKKHAGILDGFEISREEAETLIMTARVKAGWIEAMPDAAEPPRRNRRRNISQPKQDC